MERTTLVGMGRGFEDVILTEGGWVNGGTLYAAFATEEDARADDADNRALGTFGRDRLTSPQEQMATRNSRRSNQAMDETLCVPV